MAEDKQDARYLYICINCMEEKGDNNVCKHCGYDERDFEEHPSYLKPRTLLHNGRYILGKHLGNGGFGITYISFELKLQRKVVIKEYFPATLVTRGTDRTTVIPLNKEKKEFFHEGVTSFLEEARMVAKFSTTPNIVNVYDCFNENGTGYIVMDFLEGNDLTVFLKKRGGKISVEDAQQIMFPLLNALKEVHSKKLYHRDISPQNIIMTSTGIPVLIDFGAARYIVDEQSRSLDVVVKPGYSPLEQYSSTGKIGPWTDIYACGATFYQMITGKVPPSALDRLKNDNVQKPSKAISDLPPNISKKKLDNTVLHSLAVRIDDRFKTVDTFENALKKIIKPVPVPKLPERIITLFIIVAIIMPLFVGIYLLSPYIREFFTGPDPTPTPIPTSTPMSTSTTIQIQRVIIKNEQGSLINPLNDTYYLKPHEKIGMTVDVEGSRNHDINIEYSAIRGKTGANGMYTAPDTPGGRDLITVKAVDIDTGNMAQITVKIKIIGTQ